MKKFLIVLLFSISSLLIFALVEAIFVLPRKNHLSFNQSFNHEVDLSDLAFFDASDYYAYLDQHQPLYPQVPSVFIKASNFTDAQGLNQVYEAYENVDDVLLTSETSEITWSFDVLSEGFYRIALKYFPYEGKSSLIERSIKINGVSPFMGAQHVTFHRIWGNAGPIVKDIHQNDIRPSQIEKPIWQKAYFKDSTGYVNDAYQFYFQPGTNQITLKAVREPLMIDQIIIEPIKQLKTYEQVKKSYEENDYEVVSKHLQIEQAEHAIYTTSPTLYPLNDRTSVMSQPNSPSKIKLNTIGGNNWRVAGDQIFWEFEVDTTGLYALSMRVKQKLASGMSVGRNIYINGELPFKELENYAFVHGNQWRIQTLGTDDSPFLFYFEKGTHVLSMEVSLGDYGPLIAQVQNSINQLNKLYREILIYTGPEPDQFRDYQLLERIDRLVERLSFERDNLNNVRQALIDISGSKSEKTGIIDTVLLQLDQFIKKPREIHRNLPTYNGNISSLGTLVILLSAQPLEIDYFVIHDPLESLPKNQAGIFTRLWFNFKAFIATFTTDYASVGKTEVGDGKSIEVWLSIGRDQANVLRKLIDETFTRENGISVDLKLVNSAVLLPATLAEVGPDVAMGLGNSMPVNYAMRNAAYDLTQFEDFNEIVNRFKGSAMVPYAYQNGYYALPEQQIFLMLFYRSDIFEELGLLPPNTWEDVIGMIPDLQKLNLEFFLPVPITQGAVIDLPPNPIFSTMFFQNDGAFYIDDQKKSGFNDGLGPQIFETWVQFYTDYSFPVEANFVNRFRSGQMPIGITYYNTYNTLSVFAPEIRGRWNFLPVPGTTYTDAFGQQQIRRETVSTGTGIMIMEQSKQKKEAWEFLKWWTSTEIQVQFGREMEGILGAAARYPTANVDALAQLPWTVNEYLMLMEQWEWVRGIPEVPGGYMTGRHLDNAFRLVLEDRANPRETIYDFVQIINSEISKKRREFGLD